MVPEKDVVTEGEEVKEGVQEMVGVTEGLAE